MNQSEFQKKIKMIFKGFKGKIKAKAVKKKREYIVKIEGSHRLPPMIIYHNPKRLLDELEWMIENKIM